LHEYQSKSLFDQFGITVQKFKTVDNADDAEKAAKELSTYYFCGSIFLLVCNPDRT